MKSLGVGNRIPMVINVEVTVSYALLKMRDKF